MATRWLPLESNPDVMNQFIESLGVKSKHGFVDVFGFDDELLCMVPQPVYALLLLFPCSDKYEKFKNEQIEKIKKEGQDISPSLYYMKQTVSNACGTVAIIHAVANNASRLDIGDGDLNKFINSTKDLSAVEKGEKLETDELQNLTSITHNAPIYMVGISVAHEASAQEGQTETPSIDDKVDLHFVALVHIDGCLYELDGRKEFPINHGKTSNETFLKDGGRVCQEFMKRDPNEVHFTVVALCDL